MIARRNLPRSVSATSASSRDTFRRLALIELSQITLLAQNVEHDTSCLTTSTAYPDWRRLEGNAGRNLQFLYSDLRHSRINDFIPKH